MAAGLQDITITSLRGGLNDAEPPQELAQDECVQADNVEFFFSTCGERRAGCTALSLTSSGLTSEAVIAHISQWFPANVVTTPEFIAIGATPSTSVSAARRDTGGTWHTLSPNDAINNTAPDIFGITAQPLSGVDYLAYHSSVDRLHAWDGTSWRRTGLAAPAAPTAANQGTGNYSGKRYFRVRYVVMNGSTVVLRSEPSPSLTFTPSGTGASARVTKPATISEGETHWELEASEVSDGDYYRIARTAVGTTTFDDTTASSKTFPAPKGAGAPASNDGTSITYILLSDQAAALNLTGTVSNGSYGNPAGTISGRGWIGYDATDTYLGAFPATWTAGEKYYASPDVEVALEAQSSGDSGNYTAIGTLSDSVGAYLNIPSAKFLIADGDRLVYGGHWTDTALQSTVGWTPVKTDPGFGNAERAPIVTTGGEDITTTEDLSNFDGGPLTGLAAANYGTWYAFKWQRIYGAVKTGNVTKAYDINTVNSSRGALPGSIVKATDENGSGAIYFLDPNIGPCRLGPGGVVNPIRGLQATWARLNAKATSVICCGLYFPYKEQIRWWISIDGGNSPSLGIIIQTSSLKMNTEGELLGGISLMTGVQAGAYCAAALTYTVNNVTTDLPFIGCVTPHFILRCNTGTDDNGTTYTGTIRSKPIFYVGLLNKWRVRAAGLLATADANASVKLSLIRDEGIETKTTAATSLAPTGSEEQVVIQFDDLDLSELRCVQIKLTDGTTNKDWEVQRVDLKPTLEERG